MSQINSAASRTIVDEVARNLAGFIARDTGQQAVVENAPGAAGRPASRPLPGPSPTGPRSARGIGVEPQLWSGDLQHPVAKPVSIIIVRAGYEPSLSVAKKK